MTPPTAPRVVTVAVVIWAVAAMALIALGLIGLTSGETLRQGYLDADMSAESAQSYVTFVRTLSAVFGVVGLVIAALLGPVRAGSRISRRILVAISGVFAAVGVVSLAAGAVPIPPLIAVTIVVLLVVASVLIFRPAAGRWFARASQ